MKKTWNKLIIVSFIVLAVVACAAIVFLYPYYNEYKVFDGIEAGQWNEVQKSYEALDSEKQRQYRKCFRIMRSTSAWNIRPVKKITFIQSQHMMRSTVSMRQRAFVQNTMCLSIVPNTGMRSNRFIIQTRITMDRALCRRTRRSTRSIFD